MAVESTASKILEGVFAIHKPPHLSSAQVLRDLQSHFTPSKLFGPLLENERHKREEKDRDPQQRRRRPNPNDGQVKMGHGGTLDPLATGVLIIGVGNGTKQLQSFLGCTKTYETVVLFGKSTDTYDVAGKIVASAPYQHVTRELVEEKLSKFRGNIAQVPPIYSALKIQGMKAYEYARSGKELPRELTSRDMEVSECKMMDWYEDGKHEYRWPAEEASEEEKETAQKLIVINTSDDALVGSGEKRKSLAVDDGTIAPESEFMPTAKRRKTTSDPSEQPSTSPDSAAPTRTEREDEAAQHTHAPPPPSTLPSLAPATLVSLTVSSGFYVRSFAHDLGLACSSLGIMASLVRSRQGDFTLDPDSALTYTDLEAGEEVWGPKVEGMLGRWNRNHPLETENQRLRTDDRDRHPRGRGGRGGRQNEKGFSAKRGFGSGPDYGRKSRGYNFDGTSGPKRRQERRNTSSGEE